MNNSNEGGVDNSAANEGGGLFSRLGSMLFSYRSPKPSVEETNESVTDNSSENGVQDQSEVAAGNNNGVSSSQDLKQNQPDNNLNGANNVISTPMQTNKVNQNTPLFTPPPGIDIDISVSRAPSSPLFSPPLVVQSDLSDSNNTCSLNVLNVGFADESFCSFKETDETPVVGNDVTQVEANCGDFQEQIDEFNTTLVENDDQKHCQVADDTTMSKEEEFFDSQPPVEDEIAVPHKSYKLDFDQFDDPNFNPFQTKTAVRNSPELHDNVCQEEQPEAHVSKSPLPTASHISSGIEVDNSGGEKIDDSLQSAEDDLLNNGFNTADFEDETLTDDLTSTMTTETVTVETSIWTNEEVSSMQEDSEVVEINNHPSVGQEDDEIIVLNKSYSFDFDKYDDPNFNPFQTKTAVRNSPEPQVHAFEVSAPTPTKDEIELTPVDDVDLPDTADLPVTNPKEEVDAVISKATAILQVDDSTSQIEFEAYNCNSQVVKNVEEMGGSESQKSLKNEADVEVPLQKFEKQAEAYDENEIILPKKSYNFDFDQFDDPNYNPFQTKTAVCNSPEPQDTSIQAEPPVKNETLLVNDIKLEEKSQESSEAKIESDPVQKETLFLEMCPESDEKFSSVAETVPNHGDGHILEDEQQINMNSQQAPDEETFVVAPASDKLEVDNVDDPNFNPFETKTAVRSSPEPQDTSFQAEPPKETFLVKDFKLEDKFQESSEAKGESNEIAATKTSSNFEMGESESHKYPRSEGDVEVPSTTEVPNEDEIIVPKISYNFDVDKFDDLNYNPFQTKTAVRNSPEPLVTSGQPEMVTSQPITATPQINDIKSDPEPQEIFKVAVESVKEMKKVPVKERAPVEKAAPIQNKKPDVEIPAPEAPDEDEIIVPNKSYNFDFDQFDDPNYNPFQTKTAVRNSPEPRDNVWQEKQPEPQVCKSPLPTTALISSGIEDSVEASMISVDDSLESVEDTNLLNNGFNASDVTFTSEETPILVTRESDKEEASIETTPNNVVSSSQEDSGVESNNQSATQEDDEIVAPKISYNFDFDQFDDPNYNPFQTKTAVRNSPEPRVTSGQPETMTSHPEIYETPQINDIESDPKPQEIFEVAVESVKEMKKVPPKERAPVQKAAPIQNKKPDVEIPAPEAPDEDEIIVPNKSYNFDFDQFDDPNYNPFQTKTAVRNSPEPLVTSGQPEVPELTLITSGPEESGSKQISGLENKIEVFPDEQIPTATSPPNDDIAKKIADEGKQLPATKKTNPIRKKSAAAKKPDVERPAPEAPDEDEIIVPNKSYNFDFDQFDDPNYNPFQTKTAVRNSPEPLVTSGQPETMTSQPEIYETPQINDIESDPKPQETFEVAVESVKEVKKVPPKKRAPVKKKAGMKKRKDFDFRVPMPDPAEEAPDEDEIIVPKKSYNFDFDQFDDPNYNPFQTKTAVRNSPEPLVTSAQPETMTSPPEAGDCCVNPPTIVSDLKEEADNDESPTNQNSPTTAAAAEAKPKSKVKSRLGGLRRPIAKRPPPAATRISTDQDDFDPFASRNAMQNSPPPAIRDDMGAGGDAASACGKEPYSDELGGNYESMDGADGILESSADVSTSTELEQLKNLNQGNVTERLSESEEMSVDSLVHPPSVDFVKPEVMRGGVLPTCRSDDQVNTMSAFRPFTAVRDEVQDKSLVARYELLMERKLRLNMTLKSTRKHQRQCELASENLEELIKNKSHQITQVTAEYRGKLDDFYHVRAQIHGFTCREGDIQKSISRIAEENKRLSESLEKRKRGYMASYLRLTNQLSNDHELIKGLREEQDCRTAELRDEFCLLEAKLKKSQVQVSSLESNLQSKSQQCEEMGKLCDELFSSVELNNSST